MPTALGDLVVVDLSDTIGGQYCGRLFADYGARVLLIEPEAGSPVRQMAPFSVKDGASLRFRHLNTGKRSVVLDRASEEGERCFRSLVADADVAILPPGFDAEEIERCNPRAVAVTVSAFGADGPLADWQGPEIVLQALSGMMFNNGAYGREPLYGVGERASFAAGIGAYIGALAALAARERNGRGQAVTVDSAETAAAMCFPYVMQHIYNGTVRSRSELSVSAGQVLCRDGWVCIWIYNHRWHAVCETLELTAIEDDPRFADPAVRRQNWAALFAIIQETVAGMEAEDLVDRLQAAQVIAAKAYRPSELGGIRHLKSRDYWQTVGEQGDLTLGPPYRLAATPRQVQGPAPALGEANGESFPPHGMPAGNGAAREAGLPLAGLRVIELTTAWAGPMAGRVLGFLGAETIHVESPNRVNSWRLNKEVPNPVNFPGGVPGERPFDRSFLFNSQNVNKLSCILNLKTEEGRATLKRLVKVADVVTCNFRPGTLAKLGLDYESLKAIKPDIIVAELPAFGGTGPMAGYAALGPTMEMAAGMAAMIGYRDGQPENTGPSYLDPIGGFNAAAAILTALHHRRRTGEGQYVEVPQVEAAMHLVGAELLAAIETGTDPVRDGNHVPDMAPHDAFPASGEDQWLAIACRSDAQWRVLASVIGRPDLAEDPRFATLAARKANEEELTRIVAGWSRGQDKHAAAELLQRHGIAAAPVQTAADVAASAYLAHRGFFTELEHPDAGRHRHPGLPIRLSRTPGNQRSSAPPFGHHNQHVLTEILALTPEEAAAIAASDAMTDRPFPNG